MAAMMSLVNIFLSSSTQHYISNSTLIGYWCKKASKAFWRPDLWLPLGLEWEDLEDTGELHYPNFLDVWVYPIIFGVLLLYVRNCFLVPFLLDPLAQLAGIPSKQQHRLPEPCPHLEAVHLRHKTYKNKPSKVVLMEASSRTGMSVPQVKQWLRRRNLFIDTKPYYLFLKSGFTLICHTGMVTYALVVLWTKPWLWDISEIWKGYPHHVDNDIWWFYMLGLSYYWASIFIQFSSTGSDEKVGLVIYNLFTLVLMMLSWTSNTIRYGSLMYLVHEGCNVPLNAAKMLTYAGIKKASDVTYMVTLVTCVLLRGFLYLFWIMIEVIFRADTELKEPFFIKVQGVLMFWQLGINFVWIVNLVSLVRGRLTGALKDDRSDGEELSDDEDSGDAYNDADKKKDD